jgi:hypothetical protein
VGRALLELYLYLGGVRAPPGVVIIAPPTFLRNADRAQSEGRAQREWE